MAGAGRRLEAGCAATEGCCRPRYCREEEESGEQNFDEPTAEMKSVQNKRDDSQSGKGGETMPCYEVVPSNAAALRDTRGLIARVQCQASGRSGGICQGACVQSQPVLRRAGMPPNLMWADLLCCSSRSVCNSRGTCMLR